MRVSERLAGEKKGAHELVHEEVELLVVTGSELNKVGRLCNWKRLNKSPRQRRYV
jgi:hypothetical protein